MVELFILVAVVAVVVLSLRPGKRIVLDEPLIIDCPGRYHITLAPQLRHARTFIENIAGRFAESFTPAGDTPALYFEVHPAVLESDEGNYLLAVALRGGVLYFQAINPQPALRDGDSQLKHLREYSEAVLLHHPLAQPADRQAIERLRHAVEDAAHQAKIDVRVLH